MEKTTNKPNKINIDLKKELEKNKFLLIALGVVLLSGVAYFLRSSFIAATVNGQPISRFAVIKKLEKYQGASALDSMIMSTLIEQEARKQGVKVTKDDINQEISNLEKSFEGTDQTLESALQENNMTRKDLEDQIKLQKTVQKLLGERVSVTDEEVDQYIKDNPTSFEGVEMDDQTKAVIKSQLEAEKMNSEYESFYEELKQRASINYIFKY